MSLGSRHFAPPSLFEMFKFKQVLFTTAAFIGEIVLDKETKS